MIKKFFEKITGLDKVREETARAEVRMTEAIEAAASQQREAEKARQAAEQAKLSPKEVATQKKEPWVGVLDTHVNKENVRNGFFELDWNEYFVVQLREAGYKGDSEEAVVDAWFGELCRNVGNEAGVNMNQRGAGYINVNNLGDGRTEVS